MSKKPKRRKFRKHRIGRFIVGVLVIAFIVLALTADAFFPNTIIGDLIGDTIGKFFNVFAFVESYYVALLESLTIVFFIYVLSKIVTAVLYVLFKHNKRSFTVSVVANGVLKYIFVLIGLFLILNAWGVNTQTLLAGAGILSLAISFGAQSLIEDILAGIFIISEKQFSIGDIIEIDGFRGRVVEMSLRTTKFENIQGDIKIINNASINGAINSSRNLSPAICDIAIGYDQDIEKVEKVIEKNFSSIRDKLLDIIDGPYYKGVQELSDSSLELRIIAYTHEEHRLQTIRDLNREMKVLFDKHKIQIPYQQIVVHNAKNTVQRKTTKKITPKKKKA
ncbi:MAG: mechanosensitive ion channel family protein [Bacillota bacterium]